MKKTEIVIRIGLPHWPRTRWLLVGIFAAMTLATVAWAAGVYPPVLAKFTSGTAISSSNVNTNFTNISDDLVDLDTRIKALENVHARYIMAYANQSLAQSIAVGEDIVNFNTKVYDPTNSVTAGSNWIFTAPVTGTYRVTASLYGACPPGGGNGANVRLFKNTTLYSDLYRFQYFTNGQSGNVDLNGSDEIQLSVGDTVQVKLSNACGGAFVFQSVADVNVSTFIDISLIGL